MKRSQFFGALLGGALMVLACEVAPALAQAVAPPAAGGGAVASASASTAGTVSLVNQTLGAGDKTFSNDVLITRNLSLNTSASGSGGSVLDLACPSGGKVGISAQGAASNVPLYRTSQDFVGTTGNIYANGAVVMTSLEATGADVLGGVTLKSANGTRYRVTVSNVGVLVITAL